MVGALGQACGDHGGAENTTTLLARMDTAWEIYWAVRMALALAAQP